MPGCDGVEAHTADPLAQPGTARGDLHRLRRLRGRRARRGSAAPPASCTRMRSPRVRSPTRSTSSTATHLRGDGTARTVSPDHEHDHDDADDEESIDVSAWARSATAGLPGLRGGRCAPAWRRHLLSELRRDDDEPRLPGAAEGGMSPRRHEGHAHGGIRDDADARRLARGLALIVAFMVAEVVAGDPRPLPRAALRRGPHAHRCRRAAPLARRDPARPPACAAATSPSGSGGSKRSRRRRTARCCSCSPG